MWPSPARLRRPHSSVISNPDPATRSPTGAFGDIRSKRSEAGDLPEKPSKNNALILTGAELMGLFRSILTGGQKMNIKSLLLGSAAALIAVSGARAADAVTVAEP